MGSTTGSAPHETRTTRDHDTIRRWAEARGGVPARVPGTGHGDDPGLLRIRFPEASSGERLEEIGWEAFFETFDEHRLIFLYQERTEDGAISRVHELVREQGRQEVHQRR